MVENAEIPLLYDHHTHPYTYAALQNSIDLRFITEKEQALSLLQEEQEGITIVLGWNDSAYSFESREIDQLPPLVIFNASLHGYKINKAGLELIRTECPEAVSHYGDPEWTEKHSSLLYRMIIKHKQCRPADIKRFFDKLLKQGIWAVEEMGLRGAEELACTRQAGLETRIRFWAAPEVYDALTPEDKKRIYGLKVFTDGALGTKTAALYEPYTTGERGLLLYHDEKIWSEIERAFREDKAIAIHAIGDRAIEQIIVCIEASTTIQEIRKPVRIEHAQFITYSQAERAKKLGIGLCMQPNFSVDSLWYRDRLSEEYCAANNPFRMLIDKAGYIPGEDLLFGSDGMPHGVENALEMALFPAHEGQKLDLHEFRAGYCMPDTGKGSIRLEIDRSRKRVVYTVHPQFNNR